jgi:serine/threonine-protein phosphatase PGAM5
VLCSPLLSPRGVFADTSGHSRRPDDIGGAMVGSPSTPWVEDWDFVKCKEPHNEDDDNPRREVDSKCKHSAKVVRNLLLIRHGQYVYDSDPEKRVLTELGREQAQLLGKRIKSMIDGGINVKTIRCSTLVRAKETTQIVAEQLPTGIPIKYSDLYCEARPNEPNPKYRPYDDAQHVTFREAVRVEAAYRDLFYRSCDRVCLDDPNDVEDEAVASAAPKQEQGHDHGISKKKKYPSQVDEFEVVICHANVIRYFVLRALQLDPHAWLRFSLHNCSITWVKISPSGRVSVRAIGDFGHIPHDKATTG